MHRARNQYIRLRGDVTCLPALLCLTPVHLSVSLLIPRNQHQLTSVIQTVNERK